jgi:MYXO-CTERM domain-containing protein
VSAGGGGSVNMLTTMLLLALLALAVRRNSNPGVLNRVRISTR